MYIYIYINYNFLSNLFISLFYVILIKAVKYIVYVNLYKIYLQKYNTIIFSSFLDK